jgi:hypothetical protein
MEILKAVLEVVEEINFILIGQEEKMTEIEEEVDSEVTIEMNEIPIELIEDIVVTTRKEEAEIENIVVKVVDPVTTIEVTQQIPKNQVALTNIEDIEKKEAHITVQITNRKRKRLSQQQPLTKNRRMRSQEKTLN